MIKKNLHPKWYSTKVYFNGEFIFKLGTTKEILNVDIWSGNHPFYTNSQHQIDTEGRVEKFNRKYNLKDKKSN